jgi:integrase
MLTSEIIHLCHDQNGNPKVSVYPRFLRKKTVYYGRYKIDRTDLSNGQRFITESLKTDNLDRALEVAKERYAKIKFSQEAGIGLKDMTIDEGIQKFLVHHEQQVQLGVTGWSKNRLSSYRIALLTYWSRYIGHKKLNTLILEDFDGYEQWRRIDAKQRYATRRGNIALNVSRTTIFWETSIFKQCVRWLRERNLYSGVAHAYRYKLGKRNRRTAFTIAQYRSLCSYMRRKDFQQRKAKDGKSDVRFERYRHMLRTYVLFMANTGARIGEVRHLKWRDIEDRINKLGQRVVVFRVIASKSKVKKSRQAVGRYSALRAIERWKQYLASINEQISPDKYVFCDEFGKPIPSFGIGFNTLIKNAGVESDGEGQKHTIYTLRHTYITFRLIYGKNINIYHLAENCGTSVEMIQQYYSDARPEHFVDELSI